MKSLKVSLSLCSALGDTVGLVEYGSSEQAWLQWQENRAANCIELVPDGSIS